MEVQPLWHTKSPTLASLAVLVLQIAPLRLSLLATSMLSTLISASIAALAQHPALLRLLSLSNQH